MDAGESRIGVLVVRTNHGKQRQLVDVIGATDTHYRIRALTRTRLAPGDAWLMPGEVALVPREAVRIEP